ncbi:MAG TPA: PDZ domain-containing protein [Myxococcota bacterium]|nr:PDZ domain-containing protein [Myxococcota bacterium]
MAGFPEAFVGVGVELRIEAGVPVVVRTLPGGPCAVAGLQAGDRLLAVGDEPTEGASLGDVVMRLRGAPDTQVLLGVQRGGARFSLLVRRQPMRKTGDDYHAAPTAGP